MNERLEKLKMVAEALEKAARAKEKILDLPLGAKDVHKAWELAAAGWTTLAGEIVKTVEKDKTAALSFLGDLDTDDDE